MSKSGRRVATSTSDMISDCRIVGSSTPRSHLLTVIDGFYGAYRDDAPRQDSMAAFGNDYLRRNYPQLDSIVSTRVISRWP